MRLVFLYSRLNGFVFSTIDALLREDRVTGVDLVYWDAGSDIGNQFRVPDTRSGKLRLHRRSKLSVDQIRELLRTRRPDIIYTAGWMDRGYLVALARHRLSDRAAASVCGFDDQWFGTARQRFAAMFLSPALRALFDVAWVAGAPQYHYARMMGFAHGRIASNLLSADPSVCPPSDGATRRFLFVARFHPVKGLMTLVRAYRAYRDQAIAPWPLVLIGDGPLRDEVEREAGAGVEIRPYLQPDELRHEFGKGGVGILPSLFEPWGVSLHEMATSGMPLIASAEVGSASAFVVPGHNGILVRGGDVADLTQALASMAAMSDEERAAMGRASRALSNKITPSVAAASLLSVEKLARI